jgi:hypothetical protein
VRSRTSTVQGRGMLVFLPLCCGRLAGNPSRTTGGGVIVQSAHPRNLGALALVVALFLVLFALSLILGSPIR